MRIILLLLLLLEFSLAKKVALVIGNSNYAKGYLANPINDAQLIRDTLRDDLNFDVIYKTDLTKYEMEKVIRDFSTSIGKNDIALFYYSGHGIQYRHMNYLIPLKAEAVTEGQIPSVGVDVNYILGGMDKAKLAILLLDACRNNPFRSFTKSANKGLAQISSHQRNYIVSYATEAGAVAKDGDGKNSPYALALKELLTKPINVTNLFQEVRNKVALDTNYAQFPYYDAHFIGNFKLISDGGSCTKVVNVPALYRTVREKVKVSDWKVKKVAVPARYKFEEKKILIRNSYKIYTWIENGIEKKLEPKIKTVKKKVCISDEGERYEINGEKMKKIIIFPVYKTVNVHEIEKDVDVSEIPSYVNYKVSVVPGVYKTIKIKRLVEHAKIKEIKIPPTYKTIRKRVLVSEATTKTVSVPCSEVN